ncbi:MAG: hypothetical protein HY072_05795 [Deltaproteobacteria bacterium]|nr:hypothetical protein [Deltaproteobacteria bacterium]
MRKTIFSSIAIILVSYFIFLHPAHAAKFANQFVEFELPPQWQCNLEGAEWVCQSAIESKKREAIIVLAAKLKGDQDSLDQYLTYVKKPKSYTSIHGKPITSVPKHATTVDINSHPWVDALHIDSEIPDFYTRYLATVKADIGVLVTYSINKNKYKEYSSDFEIMIKTLKVFRKPGGINVAPSDKNLLQNPIPPNVLQDTVFQPPAEGGSDVAEPKKAKSTSDEMLFYIILAVALVVLFIIWRRRRN